MSERLDGLFSGEPLPAVADMAALRRTMLYAILLSVLGLLLFTGPVGVLLAMLAWTRAGHALRKASEGLAPTLDLRTAKRARRLSMYVLLFCWSSLACQIWLFSLPAYAGWLEWLMSALSGA
tara:strand:+ start:75 stop:440 length:366 start_codon:yes stop_codon:yes gene_type:complete